MPVFKVAEGGWEVEGSKGRHVYSLAGAAEWTLEGHVLDPSERFALLISCGEGSEFGQVYASRHPLKDTSHDESALLKTKHTGMLSTLNRSQFRQVYIVKLFSLHSLSNTTREQSMKAPSPIFTVSSLGRSIPHYAPTCNAFHDQLTRIEGLAMIP